MPNKKDQIIANLTQCATEAFGKNDLSKWLDSRNNSLRMTPREYIEFDPDMAEETLRNYLYRHALS